MTSPDTQVAGTKQIHVMSEILYYKLLGKLRIQMYTKVIYLLKVRAGSINHLT